MKSNFVKTFSCGNGLVGTITVRQVNVEINAYDKDGNNVIVLLPTTDRVTVYTNRKPTFSVERIEVPDGKYITDIVL